MRFKKWKRKLKKGTLFALSALLAVGASWAGCIGGIETRAAGGFSDSGVYKKPAQTVSMEYAHSFNRAVTKSRTTVPSFMNDSNAEEPNKSFKAQQDAAGNSDADATWHGYGAYAKNHDPEDFWVRYSGVTTVGGKAVDLTIQVTDWKTQNDEAKPLPSAGDIFGHDNDPSHLGYAIGFSYKQTGVVMFSGFKWVKFKYSFSYADGSGSAPFTGYMTFQDIDQNQYVTVTDGMDKIQYASYIGGADGNSRCEADGWTYRSILDTNASEDQDTFLKTCLTAYVKDMTSMSIKYGWTGHTAIAYFDLAPFAMNSFAQEYEPKSPEKLIYNGSAWVKNSKETAVSHKLGDTYSYRYVEETPGYGTDIVETLGTPVSKMVYTDRLDDGLSYVIGSMKVSVGGISHNDWFTDSSSGQDIRFTANAGALSSEGFYGRQLVIEFQVKIKDAAYDWLGHERTSDNKYRLIPNTAHRDMEYVSRYDSQSGEKQTKASGQDTETVWAKVPVGDPDHPGEIPPPEKTVTDDDEKEVKKDTLTNADEAFLYTVSQAIPINMPSTDRFARFTFEDQIDTCLTIDEIHFYTGEKEVTEQFSIDGTEYQKNHIVASASETLLKDASFYGGQKGTVVKMTAKVHIDPDKSPLSVLREHGHMNAGDTETALTFTNQASVITTRIDKGGTWNADKKQDTGKTTTTVGIPEIPLPEKQVSDTDDLNWDGSIKEQGETEPGAHDRVTDVTGEWTYTITQKIPEHTVKLFYYASFSITDAVDGCLSYEPEDVRVHIGKSDVTDQFTIEKGEDNTLTVSAKEELLASEEFYGNKDGNEAVVIFPVKISADAETLKAVETGHLKLGEETFAHLMKLSELKKKEGFDDLGKAGDGEYVYAFLNQAASHIDSNLKYDGKLGVKDRETETVETVAETAEPVVSKESSQFEWQIGDKVDYTIRIGNKNTNSIADNVIVTDADLSKAMLPDADSIQITSVYESEEAEAASGAPDDRDIMKDSDIQYTENGFVLTIPKLYREETAVITLTCTAQEKAAYDTVTDRWEDCLEKADPKKKLTCVNGEVVDNIVSVTATLMLQDIPEEDEERVWINTPHLTIKKSAEKKEYEVGEVVKYTLEITNDHEGTLARDIVITDQIQTEGTRIIEGSIHLKDETGASYDLGKKAGKEADSPYVTLKDDRSFTITTGMHLRYDGESPFKMMDQIDERVHNLRLEGLSQEEWDSPLTHTKFVVTYEAKIEKEPENTNQIINVATAEGSNAEKVSDDEVVYLKSPVIDIEKESDKDVYRKDEIGKYTLTVTQTREDRTAVNMVITDGLREEDKGKAEIQTDTIKTFFNDKEFEPVSIQADKDSFTIETGKDLTVKDTLCVKYDVLFLSDTKEDTVTNIAKAKADNAYAEIELDVPLAKVTTDLSARKTSDPASGTVVKAGQQIIYYIDVHNDSDQTLTDVLVKDAVPESTAYVEDSASDDGKVMVLDGKEYITFVIGTLRAGSTQTLSFAVTVNEGTDAEKVIVNTAEVRETSEEDRGEDGSVPDPVWEEPFSPTNTTTHPLSTWAVDTNTVRLEVPDIIITKKAEEKTAMVGDRISWVIGVEQTTPECKVTNLVVEDLGLPEGVEIDHSSILVDGKKVTEKETVERDAAEISFVKTQNGFQIVYPVLAGKSEITFQSKVTDENLKGKEVKNTAAAISDQTPLKEDSATVKIPKNAVDKAVKEVTGGLKGVQTGLKDHVGVLLAGAFCLLGGAYFFRRRRRHNSKTGKF